MPNTTYAVAWNVDQFTGWLNTGAPVYDSATSTATYTSLKVTTANANGWGYGCLWTSFGQPLTSFYTRVYGSFWCKGTLGSVSATAQYAGVVFHCSGETGFLTMRIKPNVSDVCRLYLSTSLPNTSTWIDLGIDVISPETDAYYDFNIKGCGTTNGSISVWVNNVLQGTWTGDLTNYPNFYAVSFHNGISGTAYWITVRHVYVTNYRTVNTTLTTQTLTTAGSETGWVGNTTSFTSYPVDYTTYNGEFGAQAGQQMTFVPSAVSSATGYEPKAVIINAPMKAGVDNAAVAVGALTKNTSTSTIAVSPTTIISQSGSSYTYVLSSDPLKNGSWTYSTVNAYEFGLKRTA